MVTIMSANSGGFEFDSNTADNIVTDIRAFNATLERLRERRLTENCDFWTAPKVKACMENSDVSAASAVSCRDVGEWMRGKLERTKPTL